MHFRLNEIAAFSCPKFQKSYVFLTLVLSYFILYKPHSWIYDQFWKTSTFYQWENLPQHCLKHSAPHSWVSPPVQLIYTNLWMTEGGPADDRLPNEWHLEERKQVRVLRLLTLQSAQFLVHGTSNSDGLSAHSLRFSGLSGLPGSWQSARKLSHQLVILPPGRQVILIETAHSSLHQWPLCLGGGDVR